MSKSDLPSNQAWRCLTWAGMKVEVESGEVHQGKSQQDLAGGRAGLLLWHWTGLVGSVVVC